MTSYLSSWLFGTPSAPTPSNLPNSISNEPIDTPDIEIIEPQEEDDQDSDDGYDTDRPPAFPALNSPQRAASGTTQKQAIVTLNPKSVNGASKGLMAPPPPRVPSNSLGSNNLGANSMGSSSSGSNTLSLNAAGSGSLGVTGTVVAGNLAPLETKKVIKKSKKVMLAPGHSTLDWANLKSSGVDLRGGVTTLLRVTPTMLKAHNKKDDAWTCIGGRVYNMTPYLPYHPGGEKEMMRVAGRDGTKLFALTHAWVSAEMMMDACMVGLMVSD